MVDEMGLVTEGSSTNAWIVDEDGKLRTRDAQANILKGITRTTLMEIIGDEGLELVRPMFTLFNDRSAAQFMQRYGKLDFSRVDFRRYSKQHNPRLRRYNFDFRQLL